MEDEEKTVAELAAEDEAENETETEVTEEAPEEAAEEEAVAEDEAVAEEPAAPDYSEILGRIDDLEKFIGDVFERLSAVVLKSGAIVSEAEAEDIADDVEDEDEEYKVLEELDYSM